MEKDAGGAVRSEEVSELLTRAATLHETISDALGLMIVRCPTCDRIEELSAEDVTACLRTGWSTCCGATMPVEKAT
ncbi:hypothetical protein LCGC14_0251340 [marine sediment metagenome]|uniref:Uncharacterized protein n=1 Tax=marine sediment metagenome TaxID=412755 RepID=A0A0F9UKV0_9ZZZZ